MIGIIRQILYHEGRDNTLIVLNECQMGGEQHPKWFMPMVHVGNEEKLILVDMKVSNFIVPEKLKDLHISQNVQMLLNVQHDCIQGGCKPGGTRSQIQEREETKCTVKLINHADKTNFVINMHVLHHAHILHQYFPLHLRRTDPVTMD